MSGAGFRGPTDTLVLPLFEPSRSGSCWRLRERQRLSRNRHKAQRAANSPLNCLLWPPSQLLNVAIVHSSLWSHFQLPRFTDSWFHKEPSFWLYTFLALHFLGSTLFDHTPNLRPTSPSSMQLPLL